MFKLPAGLKWFICLIYDDSRSSSFATELMVKYLLKRYKKHVENSYNLRLTLKRTYTAEIIWNKTFLSIAGILRYSTSNTLNHIFYVILQFLLLERPSHFSCDSVICFSCISVESNSHRAKSPPAMKTEYKSLSRNINAGLAFICHVTILNITRFELKIHKASFKLKKVFF